MHGLHDRLPFRGTVQQTHRGYTSSGRTKYSTRHVRQSLSSHALCDISASIAAQVAGSSNAGLSKIWFPEDRPRLRLVESSAQTFACDGSITTSCAKRLRSSPACCCKTEGGSNEGGYALRMRATGLLPACE